jgi:hypothetical protein
LDLTIFWAVLNLLFLSYNVWAFTYAGGNWFNFAVAILNAFSAGVLLMAAAVDV